MISYYECYILYLYVEKHTYFFSDGPAIDKTGTPVMNPNFIGTDYTVTDYIVDSSWLAITIFVLLAIVFASTTFYYWRKSRRMAKNLLQEQDDPSNEDALKDDGKREKDFNDILGFYMTKKINCLGNYFLSVNS
jgi:hypothetical protein